MHCQHFTTPSPLIWNPRKKTFENIVQKRDNAYKFLSVPHSVILPFGQHLPSPANT